MKKQSAFTMIELLVVLLLIGVASSVFLPRLFKRSPAASWTTILDELNNLVFFARQEAISNKNTYRLVFQSNPNGPDSVMVEEESDDPEKPGKKTYVPTSSFYMTTRYLFAPSVKFKAIYQGKRNVLVDGPTAVCHIIPDGLVQDVWVQMVRKEENTEVGSTYRMNPFMGKFELIEDLVKPE
jgi:prepilin-type N-terminal cleavage/methylation domain-containing protein